MARRRKSRRRSESSDLKKSMGVMDRILVFIGILLIIFIVVMIWIFCRYGSIPDTLCTCVFGACTGELGITGIIQATKNKYRDRQWQKEDSKEAKENQEDLPELTWPVDSDDPEDLSDLDEEDDFGIYRESSKG